ncbi:MAG: lipase family protein [Planctomycetaceae bacterium]
MFGLAFVQIRSSHGSVSDFGSNGKSAATLVDQLRRKYQSALILPDGSPIIDEFVTAPMLAMSQTCARLCAAVYGRQESLPEAMAIDGWKFDRLVTTPDLAAVCAIVYRDDGPAPSTIVVWRGTNLLNWAQIKANRKGRRRKLTVNVPDVNGTQKAIEIDGTVHDGLAGEFGVVGRKLCRIIEGHIRAGRKIYVTGHSQGGGLAQITVAALQAMARVQHNADILPAGLITFGSMRAGDTAFAKYVESATTYAPGQGDFGIIRYRNNNDIVPTVPPTSCGYQHAGDELYIWPAGMVTMNVPWPLKLIQRIKPLAAGIIGDSIADHSVAEYVRHLERVRIP